MDFQVIMTWVHFLPEAFLGLVILATVIARITPTKKDDKFSLEAASFLEKALAFLPTIGVNPATKKLNEALKEAQAKLPKE